MNAVDIEDAIEKWEEAVRKDSSGSSLIETRRYQFPPAPVPPLECRPPVGLFPGGYTHSIKYCEPQAYDIVAITANYQSR